MVGIEWLMDRARAPGATPQPAAEDAGVDALLGWLVDAGGASGANRGAFTDHLTAAGYPVPELALSSWLAEAGLVLNAAEASLRADALRPVREIEAELRTLPTVPLTDEDAARRRTLSKELSYAMFTAAERSQGHRAEIILQDLEAMATMGDP